MLQPFPMNAETLSPGPFEKVLALERELLKPKEVAEMMGRCCDFVYGLVDEGKLEAMEPSGRQVKRKTITRRSVLMVMAESGSRNSEILGPQMEALLAWLSADELGRVIQEATRLLEKLGRLGVQCKVRGGRFAPY